MKQKLVLIIVIAAILTTIAIFQGPINASSYAHIHPYTTQQIIAAWHSIGVKHPVLLGHAPATGVRPSVVPSRPKS